MRTTSSRCSDRATSSTCRTDDVISDGYCTSATWRVSWASSLTARPITSSRSTAPARKFSIARRSAGVSGLTCGQPVDEQPVAPVGGDPSGGGVRLGDVALVLEDRHVVADGRRGHTQLMTLDDALGPDRLVGAHEVLHDGAQHGELAVVEHVASSVVTVGSAGTPACPARLRVLVPGLLGAIRGWTPSRLALSRSECHSTLPDLHRPFPSCQPGGAGHRPLGAATIGTCSSCTWMST